MSARNRSGRRGKSDIERANEDPVAYTLQTLNEHGAPLELRTAQLFAAAGFLSLSQSEFYEQTDSKAKYPKEIDLVVRYRENIGDRQWTQSIFFVECKYMKKPWVLLNNDCVPVNTSLLQNDVLIFRDGDAGLIASILSTHSSKSLPELVTTMEHSGYCLISPDERKDDGRSEVAFKAVDQLANIPIERFDTLSPNGYASLVMAPHAAFTFIHRILVVKGDLMKAYLNKSNVISADRILEGRLIMKNFLGFSKNLVIDIVTEENLPNYLDRLVHAIKSCTDLIGSQLGRPTGDEPSILSMASLAYSRK